MFFSKSENRKDITAFIDSNGINKTYGELDKLAESFADKLDSRVVMLMLCDVSLETVEMYYSALQIGIVPMLLPPRDRDEHINSLMEKYHPKYCWLKNGSEKKAIESNLVVHTLFEEHTLYETCYENYEIYEDLALLLTTSGSTGSEKMVRLSYRNLEHNALITRSLMHITSEDIGITCLPIHHCYGLSLIHMIWAANATTILFEGSVLSPSFIRSVRSYEPSVTLWVPYSAELLLNTDYKNDAFDSLRLISMGGGKQSKDLRNYFIDFCKIHAITPFFSYGQTEGTTYLATNCHSNLDNPECIGKPIPGMRSTIDSPDSEGNGELVFCGESVSLGYASGYEDLLLGETNESVLFSGDMANIDENGDIYIKGRIKRICKLLGERINLDELESIIQNKFGKHGFWCADAGDAIVVCYSEPLADECDVAAFIAHETNIHKKMIKMQYCHDIPRLSSGKVNYRKIVEMAYE